MTRRTVVVLHRGGEQLRGTEEALLALLRGIDRDELHPIVLASSPVVRDAVAELGVEAHLQDFPEIMVTRGEGRAPLARYARAHRQVVELCRGRGADVVLANGGGPCQLAVPAAARAGVPVVCLFHHPAPRAYHRMWLTGRVDEMLFASRFTAAHTRAAAGVEGRVLYIGTDAVHRFTPAAERDPSLRRSLGIGADEVVFAQVGALVPHKGHDTLLDAFAGARRDLPAARLLVIGTGGEAARLRARADALGVAGYVTFTGYVPDTVPYLRHVVDVNVLASREEGLGLVNLHASACGVPGIGSDVTGIPETIVHGETGYLFPVDDAAALARYMGALGRDAGLRVRMGAAGRRMVLERFPGDAFVRGMSAVLRARAEQRVARTLTLLPRAHP